MNPFNHFAQEYEQWFIDNKVIFQSELLALKQVVPEKKKGLEIGIGSGIFAEPLGIRYGIDPSEAMLDLARKRNLIVEKGRAENLPYPDEGFDFAAFITSVCFISDPGKAIREAWRVLVNEGQIIIAFINRDSNLGQSIVASKAENKFFSAAKLYSAPELTSLLEENGFEVIRIIQTLINPVTIEEPAEGYDKGGFVVIKAQKKQAR